MLGFVKSLFGVSPKPVIDPNATREEKNQAVRAALAAKGDDGSRVRNVRHFAHPTRRGDWTHRRKIAEVWELRGYKTTDVGEGTIMMEARQSVAGAAFDAETKMLEQNLKALDWTYDGWECEVVT